MIPLGVLAQRQAAAGGGGLMYLGKATSGEALTIPGDGTVILVFAWASGVLRTLSGVTIDGAAATIDVGDSVGKRAGAAIYRGTVTGATTDVSWTLSGEEQTVAAYYYPGALVVAGGAVSSPVDADGTWELSVAASVGSMLVNSAAVAQVSSMATLGTGEDITEISSVHRRSHGHGFATASPHIATATVSPAQTNSAYTRFCAATYTAA